MTTPILRERAPVGSLRRHREGRLHHHL